MAMGSNPARKRQSYFPVKIPLNTLSSGVGRQAPSKRLPTEAEELENMFCTNERSIDKRSGFSPVGGTYEHGELGITVDDEDNGLWYYWFEISEDVNYLFVVDYNATQNTDQLFYVYQIREDSIVPQAVQTGNNIDPEVRAYITFGNGNPKDVLRAVSIGSSIVILNTLVKAGFTSDGKLRQQGDEGNVYNLFNLDGTLSQEIDKKGQPVTYTTTVKVDPKGVAEQYNPARAYIWGDQFIADSSLGADFDDGYIYEKTGGSSPENPASPHLTASGWTKRHQSEFIPVEEYLYPDATKPYFGQSVTKFSDLRFPPNGDNVATTGDSFLANGANDMLKELYPDDGPTAEAYKGMGKVYYLSQTYLSSTPGWYRVVDEVNKPYLKKIRTPDKMSVLDSRRMPMQIFISTEESEDLPNGGWRMRKIGWDPRTAGTAVSNPGPSVFTDSDGNAVQKELKAIAYYRDRLFFATDDTLFSSVLGDFDNFFVTDPAEIEFRDPIDLNVSSNKYTPITWLVPYRDFLFLATSGETQYELLGSENQISPLSSEIAPTSFFPMADEISPILLNNNLFFYAKNRLYIYFGSTVDSTQQAFEVSRSCPGYLPNEFWDTTVSASHNTLFVVGGSGPSKDIFCFRNVISQEKIVQNAFFKHTVSTGDIQSINTIGDYLYTVTVENFKDSPNSLVINKMYMYPDERTVYRLDNQVTPSFDVELVNNNTILFFTEMYNNWDTCVITNGDRKGDVFRISRRQDLDTDTQIAYEMDTIGQGVGEIYSLVVGNKYTAKAELSSIYLRDEGNNVIPGTLNLRYGVFRHHETGMYDVEVSRKNRDPVTLSYSPLYVGEVDAYYNRDIFTENGVFKFNILGFSEDVKITILSDYIYPMNITNMEFTGKFKRIPHFLTA